jgi:hypothetical protein
MNHQKKLASAPHQQQIADLNRLLWDQQAKLKVLQEQIQADSIAALQQNQATIQARSAAHTAGLEQGVGIGVGASLLVFGIALAVRRFTRGSAQPERRAASA